MISALELLTSQITGFDAPIDYKTMLDWQLGEIRKSMRRAVKVNNFYAERFASIDISSLTSLEALSSVPFTDPDEITAEPASFVCEPQRKISRVTSLCSSGSTGAPKRLCFTDNDLSRTAKLFEMGMAPIIGNGKRCLIMMSDSRPGSIASLLKEGIERNGTPTFIYGNIENIDDAAEAVRARDTIVGIPSQIMSLCRKYPLLRPESILLSADYIPPSLPGMIRELWKCRVYEHYGMTETCFGCAVQCTETSAMHIRHDTLLIEITDPISGKPLQSGQEGEIVITTFANEAMPLFRYRTGDIGSLVTGKCECGSELPRLGKVRGRLKNRISESREKLSIERIDDLLCTLPELYSSCVSLCGEKGKRTLILHIEGRDLPKLKIKIYETLRHIIPKQISITVEEQKEKATLRGKRRIAETSCLHDK